MIDLPLPTWELDAVFESVSIDASCRTECKNQFSGADEYRFFGQD